MAVDYDSIKVSQFFYNSERKAFFTADDTAVSFFTVFAFVRQKPLPKTLSCNAVYHRKEINITLHLMERHFYCANVPNVGDFYFSVENPNNLYTIDNGSRVPLSLLQPVNEAFFEEACAKHRFFFV